MKKIVWAATIVLLISLATAAGPKTYQITAKS